MTARRIIAISAAAALGLGLAGCSNSAGDDGGAGATVANLAFNQNITHPQAQTMVELSEALAEETDGALSLEIFPDETLGDQASTIEQVQSGALPFAIVAGSLLENFSSDFSVVNLPYLYESAEQQVEVLNDDEIMGDLYDSLLDSDIQVLTAYYGGVRNVYTSAGPIETPEDLAGQKIRVIPSDTNVEMMSRMGGVGTPMAQGEVYTAIQSGVMDGGENNATIYSNLSHDEIAPYYSYTEHLMMPDYLIVNPDFWASLDDDVRAAFEELLDESLPREVELFNEAVDVATQEAEEAGAQFNEVDLDAFRDAVRPMHEDLLTSDVQQKVYDAIISAGE